MKAELIKKVCVIGGGLMGKQIALNCALHGYATAVTDSYAPALEKLAPWAKGYLAERVAKGKLTQEAADAADAKFAVVSSLEEAAQDADVVIEAIIEDVDIKKDLFTKLSKIVRPDTLLTTNSSKMPSSTFVDCVTNPERLANFHYFNPALVMKLIEVVQGPHTSVETIETLLEFARKNGKDPVWVRKEIDGFVANRILSAINNEAFYLLENEIATAQEIDIAVEKGLNHPMGPFRLMDMVGLDLLYLVSNKKYADTGVKPNGFDYIEEKYKKGELGRKSGKGWYDYTQK